MSLQFYYEQDESFKELYNEIAYTVGPYNIYENTYIGFNFIVPDYGDEFVFLYSNVIKRISNYYIFNISEYINYDSDAHIINNYNYLYFFKDDNVELKGKFVFYDTNEIITFNEFYDYNEKIKYIPKTDTFYYSEKIYFLISHYVYLDLDSYGIIDFNVCPSYCI